MLSVSKSIGSHIKVSALHGRLHLFRPLAWLQIGVLIIPSFLMWLYCVYYMSFISMGDWSDSPPMIVGLLCLSALGMALGWQLGGIYNYIMLGEASRYLSILAIPFHIALSLSYLPILLHYGAIGQFCGRVVSLIFIVSIFLTWGVISTIPKTKSTFRIFAFRDDGEPGVSCAEGAWLVCGVGSIVLGMTIVGLVRLVIGYIHLVL